LATGLDYKLALRSVDLKKLVPEEVWEQANETGGGLDRRFHCLASGPLPPNPAELLSSDLMTELLKDLSASTEVDYVVIDSPPVLPVADALILAPNVDAVMVVTRMNWSTQAETQETCKRLRRSDARVIGVVASGVKMATKGHHRSRQYYQYDYR
jgi:Mrp family chromosome partitioning ATPase